ERFVRVAELHARRVRANAALRNDVPQPATQFRPHLRGIAQRNLVRLVTLLQAIIRKGNVVPETMRSSPQCDEIAWTQHSGFSPLESGCSTVVTQDRV